MNQILRHILFKLSDRPNVVKASGIYTPGPILKWFFTRDLYMDGDPSFEKINNSRSIRKCNETVVELYKWSGLGFSGYKNDKLMKYALKYYSLVQKNKYTNP